VAMNTAGRSITFAGLTVIIALSGLYILGVNLLYGVALAASASVLFVLAGSLTLLPAVLSVHGRRVGEGRHFLRRRTTAVKPSRSERWVRTIQRRPLLAAVGATALLLALAGPAHRPRPADDPQAVRPRQPRFRPRLQRSPLHRRRVAHGRPSRPRPRHGRAPWRRGRRRRLAAP